MDHDWANIYLYLAMKLMEKKSKEEQMNEKRRALEAYTREVTGNNDN